MTVELIAIRKLSCAAPTTKLYFRKSPPHPLHKLSSLSPSKKSTYINQTNSLMGEMPVKKRNY